MEAVHRAVATGAAAAALLALGAPAAPAQDPTYTIRVKGPSVTALGPWKAARAATIADAVAVFGEPVARERTSDVSCRVRWRTPRLSVVFVDLGAGAGPICSDTRAKAQSFVTRDRAFATVKGLRPTMEGRQVLRRHPDAVSRRGGFWLSTARLFGATRRSAVLRLTWTRDVQHIDAFKGRIGAAGE